MANKIWIREVIDKYFDVELKVDTLIRHLEDLKSNYPDHKDFEIEKSWNGYDDGESIQLVAYRLETDKEFDKRVKLLRKEEERKAKDKADADEAEKELYDKLKKKFEK